MMATDTHARILAPLHLNYGHKMMLLYKEHLRPRDASAPTPETGKQMDTTAKHRLRKGGQPLLLLGGSGGLLGGGSSGGGGRGNGERACLLGDADLVRAIHVRSSSE